MIHIHNLSLTIDQKDVLSAYTGSFMPGHLVGLTGPNGSGKTTLLRTLAGLHASYTGTILFNHKNMKQLSPNALSQLCAYVPAEPICHWPLTVTQILSIVSKDRGDIEILSKKLKIESLHNQNFQTLSSGEKARVLLVQALLRKTPILILDELTSHLDESHTHEIMSYLKSLAAEGKTIFLSLHDVEEGYLYCDTLLKLCGHTLKPLKKKTPILKELRP
ncbi:MAG: ABC transporter ATP-binding protein [Holosporaceae bacterium]|nr:MAG: ABC transporter ATP-binding protein [Holosporaceae bacterium]